MNPFYKLSLSASQWQFKQADNESHDAWLPAPAIPSVVHQDLLANKKISDPLIGFNELDAEWISEKSWIYRTTIQKPAIPEGANSFIVFDGLDTFATVYLDGKLILQSDNMFLTHRVDVTSQLLDPSRQSYTLEVVFDSALLKAREIQKSHPQHKWVGFNGETARLAVRKSQYHWGWDWGPLLMTAGIWRDVRLEIFSARIADVWTEIKLSHNHETAHVTAFAKVQSSHELNGHQGTFYLKFGGQELAHQDFVVGSDGTGSTTFTIEQPNLWWPNGYGDQSLYELSVAVTQKGGDTLHQISKRFGIRTAEIVQKPDKHGKSFFFRINGVDIFCGGSCWIPADSFLPRVSEEKYRNWIKLMIRGNQAMIRVWGGGIYEEDAFYDACDELGVLVWQDFMFGCGNYPTWPTLLDSIKREAIENVSRLRHHPSIVLYAGNNEDYQVQEQAGLTYNFDDKDPQQWLQTDFPARYIYENLLPAVVKEYSPHVFYHPGSPWGDGKITSDPTVGDLHQWNVWHGSQEKYQIFGTIGGRFNSEFGMEAFPHLKTIEYFVEDKKDLFPQSRVIDFHNKADGHERRLATYLVENLRTATDLETYIYLTQVVQEETMMFGYRAWRRQWGDERHCGGALLWQLNDCWPTISWAIVDYFLRPKPAYYAMARILAPIAVGVQREHHDWSVSHARPAKTSKFELWAVSSLQEEVNALVELKFISIDTGLEIRDRIVHENIRLVANGTTNIILDGVIDHKEYPESHVLAARVWVDGRLVARDIDWPQPLKYLDFSNRGIKVHETDQDSSESSGKGQRSITISTLKPVKCLVFEERDGITISDSALDIVPGDDQVIEIEGLKPGDEPLKWKYLGQELGKRADQLPETTQ
ncbi:Beta-mannosidase B [Talaromyces atroroseus]|uniref:Beta-mannosidase B n=1 Tax=Talaromyces atroroseus TaxID=1441469 RepID=A0A225AXU6_TALAT|nr:Beta-mannosidase B [Talaromyces atroroseus]OKL62158.1 Beta-mannosidase B [Talaromyces atroroseus]